MSQRREIEGRRRKPRRTGREAVENPKDDGVGECRREGDVHEVRGVVARPGTEALAAVVLSGTGDAGCEHLGIAYEGKRGRSVKVEYDGREGGVLGAGGSEEDEEGSACR